MNTENIPMQPMIESNNIPVEWLHELAIREGNSKKPIYQIHKWWARRLSSVFRALLLMAINTNGVDLKEEFYKKHDQNNLVVLDPFMGGGTSIVEASKINAYTIGIDIDPIAWFITKMEVDLFDNNKVLDDYEKLKQSVAKEISSYYITCIGTKIIPVTYFFWVDLITCPKCNFTFEAHPHFMLSVEENKKEQTVFCNHCHAITTIPITEKEFRCHKCQEITIISSGNISRGKFKCPNCNHRGQIISTISKGSPLEKKLFALEYVDNNEFGKRIRKFKTIDEFDNKIYQKAKAKFEELKNDLPFPVQKVPVENRNDARPVNYGFEHYYQLFNERQLLCLSLIWKRIQLFEKPTQEYLIIAFSDCLTSNNLLCRYAFAYEKLTPLFGIHAYDIVHRPVENNVWGTVTGRGSFSKCFFKMLKRQGIFPKSIRIYIP